MISEISIKWKMTISIKCNSIKWSFAIETFKKSFFFIVRPWNPSMLFKLFFPLIVQTQSAIGNEWLLFFSGWPKADFHFTCTKLKFPRKSWSPLPKRKITPLEDGTFLSPGQKLTNTGKWWSRIFSRYHKISFFHQLKNLIEFNSTVGGPKWDHG